MWPFSQKPIDTETWKTTHCARCGNKLTSVVLEPPPHSGPDFEGVRYCSKQCYDAVFIPTPPLQYRPSPTPAPLLQSDKPLLIGKSSGGKYFEGGRCAYCGQVIPNTSHIEFQFCSDSCRSSAIRPYLPADFHSSLIDDARYRKFGEALSELVDLGAEGYIDEKLHAVSGRSYHDSIDLLRRKQIEAEAAFEQRKLDQEHSAIQQYVEHWTAQRDYILQREKTKAQEQEAERLRKKQEAEQKAEQKRIEDEMRRSEEERKYVPVPQPPVEIPEEVRFSGHWIIAPPGRGKTNLLQWMFWQDMQRPASIIVMDSKGDLLEPIKKMKAVYPRLVLIEPDINHPIALNPLDIPGATSAHVGELLEYVFVGLLGADFTDLQLAFIRNVLPAVLRGIHSPNLETFRQVMISGFPAESVPLLPPHLQQFFNDRHNGFYSDTYSSTRKQIVWRIDYLLANDVIRTMFAATKTKFDIGREMDAGKVILINNSKRLLGKAGCEFFGRFFIALILAASHGRSGRSQGQKLPCFFYIDECHDVISEDENTAEIMDQCRSQKIATIYAHQRTDQIKSQNVLSALSNCAVRYANSDDEARFLSEKLRATPEYLRALPKGCFAAYIRDVTREVIALQIPHVDLTRAPQQSDLEHQALRNAMWKQFSSSSSPPVPPPSAQPAIQESIDARSQAIPPEEVSSAPSAHPPVPKQPDPGEPSSDY